MQLNPTKPAQQYVGTVYVVYPVEIGVSIAVERAPDVAGFPGTWVQIATVNNPPLTGYPVTDILPNATDLWWYRFKETSPGFTDSDYSPSGSSYAVILPSAAL